MERFGEEIVVPTVESSHCGGACLLRVHVKDGVITRIESDEGEEPQQRACWRGRAYRQRVYAADRILYPLKRVGERGEGRFERISWDEALGTVAANIVRCRDTYGPASILCADMGGDTTLVHSGGVPMQRLLAMAGGYTGWYGVASFGQGMFASTATYGTIMASNSRDDLLNSKLILLWGMDPAKSINGTNTAWYLSRAKENGAKIISVDPRLCDTAATLAHEWVPIRPSSDAAALMAMAYVLIEEGRQDQAFLDQYTIGFDKYRDYLLGMEDGKPKDPTWAEGITGIPAATIARLAREYATLKPAALLAGVGPGRTDCGEMYHRAASVLAAMTGNVGVSGGDAAARGYEAMAGGLPYKLKGQRMYPVPNPVEAGAPPVKEHLPTFIFTPKFGRFTQARVQMGRMADAILRGRSGGYPADYKMLVVWNSAYLNSMPNVNKTAQALRTLEFIAINEQHMTPTAKFADIVLPSCTYMERNDVCVGQQTAYFGYQNRVIEPRGESKSPLDICNALAEKLGLADYNDKTEDEWLRGIVGGTEIPDYDQFKNEAIHHVRQGAPYVAFRKQIEDPEHNPFPTPSGKIEICSTVMAEWHSEKLPPIPKWVEPREFLSDPLAREYPLQLITPHGKRRANAQFDNIPWLRELMPQNVWVNTDDARQRGIRTDDPVKVFNGRGTIVLPAKVTSRIMPGVVQVEAGAWFDPDANGVDCGGNANVLTKDEPAVGGHFAFNSVLVEVEKSEAS